MYNYPSTKRSSIVENHFGHSVQDPYRWMEDVLDPDLSTWVDEQIACTNAYINGRDERPMIESRLRELYNYPKYGMVKTVGKNIIFSHNTGLQPQYVYWIQSCDTGMLHDGSGFQEILLDPNTLSSDGTMAVSLSTSSKDDKYLALLQADSGSDWQQLKIIDLETKVLLPDVIEGVKFTYVAWFRDGFIYSRYALPEKGQELSAKNEDMSVYFHRLGSSQSEDVLIFRD